MASLHWYCSVRSCFSLKSRLLSSLSPVHACRDNWGIRFNHRQQQQQHPRTLVVEAPSATENLRYETLNNGGMMKFTWANGESAAFHAVWLRHNCQCPSCLPSSNQKSINPSVLDPNLSVTSSSVSGLFWWSIPHVSFCVLNNPGVTQISYPPYPQWRDHQVSRGVS